MARGADRLVSCRRDAFAKSLDLGEDGIGRSRPDEGLALAFHWAANRSIRSTSSDTFRNESRRTALAGDDIEPDLHLVEPRGVRGGV